MTLKLNLNTMSGILPNQRCFPDKNKFNRVEEKLNSRPRKRFGYLSPNQVFLQTINNNGQVAFIT